MAITVVVGGQYGSEGKGKLVSYLASRGEGDPAVVRCGGANAGHTAEGCGRRAMLRQLPSGAVNERCQLFLAAGMQLDLEVLLREIAQLGVDANRLAIDANATVLGALDRELEEKNGLGSRISSTLTGTGGGVARKALRDPRLRRAIDVPELRGFIGDTASRLHAVLRERGEVIVEGTQGAGLSLHHGSYPWVTSRDTTAAAFLSEAGLPPTQVRDVVVVLRTYPIRVGGPSGPLHGELDWEEVRGRSGCPQALAEYTTVTGRLRRVGEFDWELAHRAVGLNGATALAIHGLDYLCHGDLGRRRLADLSNRSRRFIAEVEDRLGVPVRFLFTGPDGGDIIDREHASALSSPSRHLARIH